MSSRAFATKVWAEHPGASIGVAELEEAVR
jgi:hypothetical protein